MHLTSWIRAFVACFLLGACSSREVSPTHSFRIYEENGVTIAETTGGPQYEGELFRFEEILTLQEDERFESLLNRPSHFLMDSNGYYYVADSGDSRIAVFDAKGRFIQIIGREGSGPGEFQLPIIQNISNGIISVFDLRLRRTTRYRTDGSLLDIITLPTAPARRSQSGIIFPAPLPNVFQHLNEERLVQILSRRQLVGDDEYGKVEVIISTIDLDTLSVFSTNPVLTGFRYPTVHRGIATTNPGAYVFRPIPMAVYNSSQGIVLSSGAESILYVYDSFGVQQKQIRLNLPPNLVTDRDRAAIMAEYERRLENTSEQARSSLKDQMDHVRFAEVKPPWFGFLVDDSGFIWLMDMDWISETEIEEYGANMMVVSPEGEYLGKSKIPGMVFAKFTRGLLLANNQNSETGEYKLKVYAIHPLVEGLEYP